MTKEGNSVKKILIFFAVIFLQMFGTANAEIKIYTGSDIYIMSESDNLGLAKEKAKQKSLRNAQEQAGVYVSSYTKVINNQVTHDEIVTMTNGILEVLDVNYIIADEKIDDINGITIKAEVKVRIDSDKIDAWLDKEIAEKHKKRLELQKEIDAKNKQLSKIKINIKQELDKANKLLEKNKPKPAMEIINNVRQFETDNYYTYFLIGKAHYKMKKYDTAIEYFNKSLQLNKNFNWSYHGLGLVYYELKEYWIANQYFTKAIELKPDELTYSWRGLTYSKMGKKDLAERDYVESKRIFNSKYK